MMLSELDEQMLGRFHHLFYRSTGILKDPRTVIHGLKSIVSYGARGSAFDQQLEGGFKMIFQHYGVRATSFWPRAVGTIPLMERSPEGAV